MSARRWLVVVALLVIVGAGRVYIIAERGKQYEPLFKAAGAKHGVPWELLAAQAAQESGYDASAVSPVGAQGIMQFMPATAAQFGIDAFNPAQAIDAAASYDAQLYREFGGSWPLALIAYNWGPGNLKRHLAAGETVASVPAESEHYFKSILGNAGIAYA